MRYPNNLCGYAFSAYKEGIRENGGNRRLTTFEVQRLRSRTMHAMHIHPLPIIFLL